MTTYSVFPACVWESNFFVVMATRCCRTVSVSQSKTLVGDLMMNIENLFQAYMAGNINIGSCNTLTKGHISLKKNLN